MAEYIEREAAKAMFNGIPSFGATAEMMIDCVPAADVAEVRRGEWFVLDECANEGVYCSVCHKKVYRVEYANQKVKSNFCPNCGARMNGGGQCD